jgi:hypothetical protein
MTGSKEATMQKSQLTVYIPLRYRAKRPVERLQQLAKGRDRSMNYLVVQALITYLNREERKDRHSA